MLESVWECLGIVWVMFGCFRDTLRSSGAILLEDSGGAHIRISGRAGCKASSKTSRTTARAASGSDDRSVKQAAPET